MQVSREPVYVLTEYMPHGNLLNYFLSEAGQNAVLVERIHMAVQVRIIYRNDCGLF